MQRSEPDVTVVIPCYNAERWVGRAIQSALDQEGVAVEVVVVDDGSTDGSLGVIESFGDRIRWEAGPNRGACAARNRGLALAEAPYVMFLDADDYVEGPLLAAAVRRMREGDTDLGFGVFVSELAGSRRPYRPGPMPDHLAAIAVLLESHFIPPCATLWRRAFLQAIGGWKVGLRRNQDFEVVFRALAQRPRVAAWHEGTGVYFQHWDFARISQLVDAVTASQQADVLRSLRTFLTAAGLEEARALRLVRRKAYQLCRASARSDDPAAFHVARTLWREMGGRGHIGTWRHVALATLLGLRTKERLARRFRTPPHEAGGVSPVVSGR